MSSTSLITTYAQKLGVEPNKLLDTLKKTAFKQSNGAQITNEQMMALLVVANQHGLNPFTREIYAFPDKTGGIVPVVGVDGWTRIINSHDDLDGIDFEVSLDKVKKNDSLPCHEWMKCSIYRKNKSRPITITEHLDECYRLPFKTKDGRLIPGPWQTHPKRMLRHKSLIQCARIAFSFSGMYDEDEAENIIQNEKVIYKIDVEEEINTSSESLSKSDELVNILESKNKGE